MSRMGTAFLYDGSVDGLMCAIAAAIKSGDQDSSIYPRDGYQKTLFDQEFYVAVDPDQLERLWRYLNGDLSKESVRHILNGILYDGPERDEALFRYIKLSLKHRKQLDNYHTEPAVLALHEISQKVGLEAHRFKGLLRFREMQNGILYAPFNPDHRVIYSVAHHFQSRLRGEQWIIHDLTHRMAVYWDGNKLEDAELSQPFLDYLAAHGHVDPKQLHQDENVTQQLWRVFFDSIAIKARRNPGLQRNLLPRRYWKYLTEMQLKNPTDNV